MKCAISSASRTGSSHPTNQDAFAADESLGTFIVCDGIGGHRGADVAAQLAASSALEYLRKHSKALDGLRSGRTPSEKLANLCSEAVMAANSAVHSRAQADANLSGMGTTMAMVVIVGGYGVVAHAGSSRVYLCRNGQLIQLTKDHRLSQELVERGLFTEEKAAKLAYARALSKAVGLLEAVTPDVVSLDVLPGDRFLLATDGVTQALPKEELQRLVSGPGGASAAEAIVQAASERSLGDDATAMIVAPTAGPQEAAAHTARSEEVLLKTESLQEMFLFHALDAQAIVEIVQQSSIVHTRQGEELFAQGSHEQNVFIILDGTFDVVVDGNSVAHLAKGSHFGEMSWLSHEPRSATVRCISDGTLLKISASFMQSFILKSPENGVRILRELARELSSRLRAANALAVK